MGSSNSDMIPLLEPWWGTPCSFLGRAPLTAHQDGFFLSYHIPPGLMAMDLSGKFDTLTAELRPRISKGTGEIGLTFGSQGEGEMVKW